MNPSAMQSADGIYTGLLFVGRNPRPTAGMNASLSFELVFDLISCLGPHAKENWTLIWRGEEAREFWDTCPETLRTPGQPFRVTACHLRAHVAGRVPGIHAHVLTCELAPRRAPATPATQPETV